MTLSHVYDNGQVKLRLLILVISFNSFSLKFIPQTEKN